MNCKHYCLDMFDIWWISAGQRVYIFLFAQCINSIKTPFYYSN